MSDLSLSELLSLLLLPGNLSLFRFKDLSGCVNLLDKVVHRVIQAIAGISYKSRLPVFQELSGLAEVVGVLLVKSCSILVGEVVLGINANHGLVELSSLVVLLGASQCDGEP